MSAVLLSVLALLGAPPARAQTRPACDLAAVAGMLADTPPLGPKPPTLPVASFGGTAQEAFPREVIEFSPDDQLVTGIVRVRKGRLLSRGAMGAVYEAEVEYRGGRIRHKAWKEIRTNDRIGSESERAEAQAFALRMEGGSMELQYEAALWADHVMPMEVAVASRAADGSLLSYGFVFEKGGDSLGNFLRGREGRTMAIEDRVRLAEIVAAHLSRALEGLRARGIVHQDLKPDNLVLKGGFGTVRELLDGAADVQLIDLGLSAREGATPLKDMGVGTYPYLPPEYQKDLVHRSSGDLYAHGLILAEILTGKAPNFPKPGEPRFLPRPGFSQAELATALGDRLRNPLMPEPLRERLKHLSEYLLRLVDPDPARRPREVFNPKPAEAPRP